jgi:hypothetical protein
MNSAFSFAPKKCEMEIEFPRGKFNEIYAFEREKEEQNFCCIIHSQLDLLQAGWRVGRGIKLIHKKH